MAAIKQSLAWWALANKLGADALIKESKRIGYAGVEMAPENLWPQITDGGLQIVTMGGHKSLSDGLNRRENHDRIEAEINANLELAVKWHIPALIVFSGNRNGLPDAAGIEHTAEGLSRVAKAAEQAGVTLVLELLNSKVNHPDYQCDHTVWGVDVCKLVNSPRVKLLYDIYHMQIMEGDVISCIRWPTSSTSGISIRPEFLAGTNWTRIRSCTTPLSAAPLPQPDYEGYIGQEFTPKGDPVAALEQAYKVCSI